MKKKDLQNLKQLHHAIVIFVVVSNENHGLRRTMVEKDYD